MRMEKGKTVRKQEKNGRKWERERGENGFHDSCPKKNSIFLNTLSCLKDCLI